MHKTPRALWARSETRGTSPPSPGRDGLVPRAGSRGALDSRHAPCHAAYAATRPRRRRAAAEPSELIEWHRGDAKPPPFFLLTGVAETTPDDGYLGSRIDEERSEMRYVMRIAELRESSSP